MPFFLIAIFALPICAAVSGESRYASLSENAGMQGNPAALSAFGSPGFIVSYERPSFLFGLWGDNQGAHFDWTGGENGYDASRWSYLRSFSNSSRSFFRGSRFSAERLSDESGTSFSWSPGFIFRPLSYISLGFWSENLLQYGFYQSRMQNAGISIRPVDAISFSWNAKIKSYEQLKHFSSQPEQNLLLELEFWGITLGIEFPFIDPGKDGEFRVSYSMSGAHFNSSIAYGAKDLSERGDFRKDFRRFSFSGHSALQQETFDDAPLGMVRVALGSIEEKSGGWSFFGAQGSSLEMLRKTLYLLEKANASAVLFDFSNYSGTFGISQEIRRGINSLKNKGTRVAAYTNDFRPSIIYAASAADKIILQPSALVDFKGFSGEVLYYKGLLDWAGVKFEMMRHGSHKSAMEPYALDSMSAEARENLQGILSGWWEILRDSLARSRDLSKDFLDSIASNPKITASAAKKNGLADTLLYFEDVPKYVAEALLSRKGRRAINAHFENWYLSNKRMLPKSWEPRDRIAVINIDGAIVGGYGSNDPLFGKSVAGVQDLIEQIDAVGYGGYKALILRINSPGGSAIASDELWHSIEKLKEETGIPVIASVGDMAASGAYYAAVAADKIVAEASSVVGSIGIYGGKVNASGLLEKLKIKTEVVKTHESANSESIAEGFSEREREALQEYMDEFYVRFTGAVASGRGFSRERTDSLGGGRVFTGAAAKKNGLADEIGGFGRAIEIAMESAYMGKNVNAEIVYMNNLDYSFADRVSSIIKGESKIYPLLKSLEKTQAWAIYF